MEAVRILDSEEGEESEEGEVLEGGAEEEEEEGCIDAEDNTRSQHPRYSAASC
jgi:hypothetical protein